MLSEEVIKDVSKMIETMKSFGISSKDFHKHSKIEEEITKVENNNPIKRK